MDKYQMLDEIVLLLDRLADSRGVERCAVLAEVVNRIGALKTGLKEEEKAHDARIELLKAQLKKLTEPATLEDGEIREGGETYVFDLEKKE